VRLSPATAGRLPASVARPAYARNEQAVGIVHLGVGAFHRAHQVVYTDAAMSQGDRNWNIAGVSLRSPDVHDQLAPQGGLYTVTERDGAASARRLIGALAEVIVAPHAPWVVVERLAAPTTHIVSLTVTEKGYHAGLDGQLDWTAPAVAADLAGEAPPQSLYGLIRHGLAHRRAEGLGGLTLMSCDNLSGNGEKLAAWLGQFLERCDPQLGRWFAAECACPSSMVDRIVPATTEAVRQDVAAALGLIDQGAVVTEAFHQWVIEDRFAGPRPRWEAGGARLVGEVRPYETAKLRMLNGAHSALAYLGLLRGQAYVHEAVGDPALRTLVRALMAEAAASLSPAPGQDLDLYVDDLLARFANTALSHRLDQIAADGSQKIQQRWLPTLAWRQRRGLASPALLTALAAWTAYVRGDRFTVADPLAGDLAGLWTRCGEDHIVAALFGDCGRLNASWTATAADQEQMMQAMADIRRRSPA
jgi:fructuronate reductase